MVGNIADLTEKELFELLSASEAKTLQTLAEKLGPDVKVDVLKPPEPVVVMSRIRETVNNAVFNLGEVLATEAEVAIGGKKGYMLVMGLERSKALNGAILYAVVTSGHHMSGEIVQRVREDREAKKKRQREVWEAVKKTHVSFIGGKVEEFKTSDRAKDR